MHARTLVLLPCTLAIVLSMVPMQGRAQDAKNASNGEALGAKVKLTEAGLAVHRSALLIDGHNDLPWQMRNKAASSFDRLDIAQSQPELHTDIARLHEGGVGAQFWSAYVPATTIRTGDATRKTLEQIDVIHRMVERYPETFEMASTADDVERIVADGKIASLIGVEGGHSIENSLGVLRTFYALGVRYMTLTHSDTLDWADSATDDSVSGGLSPFGLQVVEEMNRLGMLVDISHVSVNTMLATLRTTKAPVIASHSSAYAIAQHARNVPDHVLELVADNGGVIMVNFYSGFIHPESAQVRAKMFDVRRELREKHPDEAEFRQAYDEWESANPMKPGTVHTVVDHIAHIAKVAGVDHVGLGSDFDGVTMLPDQLEDVSTYPYITQELLNRGFTPEDVRKILGGNVLRAMREAEQAARDLND